MRRLHPDLTSARETAESFRIVSTATGHSVWRFRPWSDASPGWRCVATSLTTRQAAERWILQRLNLAEPSDDTPSTNLPIMAHAYFDFGWDGT